MRWPQLRDTPLSHPAPCRLPARLCLKAGAWNSRLHRSHRDRGQSDSQLPSRSCRRQSRSRGPCWQRPCAAEGATAQADPEASGDAGGAGDKEGSADFDVGKAGPKHEEAGLEMVEFPPWGGREWGYTPYEYLTFSNEELTHDLSVIVDAPVSKVYAVWADRMNYLEWFDLVGQVVLDREDPSLACYFLFYKWGQLPTLELYTTLERTVKENEYIMERGIDGMDFAAAAYFREKDGGTEVQLRVAYFLPDNLKEFVGPVGVWGDVDDILRDNMTDMKDFVEGVDLEDLAAHRADDADMMEGVSEEQWQAYKAWLKQLQEKEEEEERKEKEKEKEEREAREKQEKEEEERKEREDRQKKEEEQRQHAQAVQASADVAVAAEGEQPQAKPRRRRPRKAVAEPGAEAGTDKPRRRVGRLPKQKPPDVLGDESA